MAWSMVRLSIESSIQVYGALGGKGTSYWLKWPCQKTPKYSMKYVEERERAREVRVETNTIDCMVPPPSTAWCCMVCARKTMYTYRCVLWCVIDRPYVRSYALIH